MLIGDPHVSLIDHRERQTRVPATIPGHGAGIGEPPYIYCDLVAEGFGQGSGDPVSGGSRLDPRKVDVKVVFEILGDGYGTDDLPRLFDDGHGAWFSSCRGRKSPIWSTRVLQRSVDWTWFRYRGPVMAPMRSGRGKAYPGHLGYRGGLG